MDTIETLEQRIEEIKEFLVFQRRELAKYQTWRAAVEQRLQKADSVEFTKFISSFERDIATASSDLGFHERLLQALKAGAVGN